MQTIPMEPYAPLDQAADIMREKLFKPMGLDVPRIPIGVMTGSEMMIGAGVTRYDKETREPVQIAISPLLPDAAEAFGVLAHEMVHAALPRDVQHGEPFASIVKQIGLKGDPRATVAGKGFRDFYNKHLRHLA
jgi:hypothetical protein